MGGVLFFGLLLEPSFTSPAVEVAPHILIDELRGRRKQLTYILRIEQSALCLTLFQERTYFKCIYSYQLFHSHKDLLGLARHGSQATLHMTFIHYSYYAIKLMR